MEIKPINMQINIENDYYTNTNRLEIEQISKEIPDTMVQNAYPGKNTYGEKKPEEKEVKKSVDKLNKLLEDKETYLQYEVYGKFNDITIKIINKKTKETIKEIPPKKIIDMVAKLCELAGFFVDEKV